MKDLWIFVDELQAITARQRNCFSCSIIDANRMQDSLKNLMKMENKRLAWKYIWNDTKIVVVVVVLYLVQSYCLQPLAELLSLCKHRSVQLSDFINFLFFLQEKIGFRSFIFLQVITYHLSLSIVNESLFKFRRIFYTAASIICCLFLFCNMREILTRNVYFTKFSNFHENIAVCRN